MTLETLENSNKNKGMKLNYNQTDKTIKLSYNQTELATTLGVSPNTLRSEMKKRDIYKDMKDTKIYFGDKLRVIFRAFGFDYDVFFENSMKLNKDN